MFENLDSDNNILNYILGRLREPSTWAGIAIFVGNFGADQDTVNRLVANGPAIAVGVAALIAVFAKSSGSTAKREAREAKAIALDAAEKTEETRSFLLTPDPTLGKTL